MSLAIPRVLSLPVYTSFLSAFEPRLDGTVVVSQPNSWPGDALFFTLPLTDRLAPLFSQTIWYAVLDAARLVNERGDRGKYAPFLLPGDEDWVLQDYEQSPVPIGIGPGNHFDDGSRVFPYAGRIRLASRQNRLVEFNLLRPQFGPTISVGFQSDRAAAFIEVAIDSMSDHVLTDGYFFCLAGRPLQELRATLGLTEAPLYEVGLAVANRIYASGHYTKEELLRRKNETPYRPGERFTITSLRMTKGATDACLRGPMVRVEGLPHRKRSSLAIWLNRPPQPFRTTRKEALVPLAPSLRTLLWNPIAHYCSFEERHAPGWLRDL